MTSPLIVFLRARLNEDERVAQNATDGPWTDEYSKETGHCVLPADAQNAREYVARTQPLAALPDAQHIARHDPARVLREVESKRGIVNLHKAEPYRGGPEPVCVACSGDAPQEYHVTDWPCTTLRLLALPYADHPDYLQEWRP